MSVAEAIPTRSVRLERWQGLTVGLMVAGYSGYYLCRSNFSVALPMIVADLASQGIDAGTAKVQLGRIASLGTLAYALGKFLAGGTADRLGGRRNYLGGMAGSILFTVGFALAGSLPLFTLAWIGNRTVQSFGWAGMVKITSRWFSYSSYGRAMGIISLSFLFGDAASRRFLQALIGQGMGWREIFLVAASVLAVLLLINAWFVRESPTAIGEHEPRENPANLFGPADPQGSPLSLRRLLGPLVARPVFWVLCGLSLGFTLVRETFNTWSTVYFTEVVRLSQADAAGQSSWFPLLGGMSVLIAGYLADKLGRVGRASLILAGLLVAGAAMLVLGLADFEGSRTLPVVVVAVVGFALIGPYSYLAGAISLDLGGKQGSATTAGIIDGVGYLGGILAGESVARIAVGYGWPAAFTTLAGVAFLSCWAGVYYLIDQLRPLPATPSASVEIDR